MIWPPNEKASDGVTDMRASVQEGVIMATGGAFERVLNMTLAEFIRSFSRDPAVLEALRNVN